MRKCDLRNHPVSVMIFFIVVIVINVSKTAAQIGFKICVDEIQWSETIHIIWSDLCIPSFKFVQKGHSDQYFGLI